MAYPMKNEMKKKINAGVLFCGGCNPYFDRALMYGALVAEYEDMCDFSFFDSAANEEYEIVALINGCQSECLMEQEYSGKFLLINNINYQDANKLFGKLVKEIAVY